MARARQPLKEYLQDPASAELIDRVRMRLAASREARRTPSLPAMALAAMALAALTVVLVKAVENRQRFVGNIADQRGPATPETTVAIAIVEGAHLMDHHAGSGPGVVSFADGSTVRLASGSRLSIAQNTGPLLELSMAAGEATFDIVPGGPRLWRIDAGLAEVEVLGTQLRVVRAQTQVRVSVTRGVVQVREAGARPWRRLTAGHAVSFGAADGRAASAKAVAAAEPNAGEVEVQIERADRSRTVDWRQLAGRGQYRAAFERLGHAGIAAAAARAADATTLLLLSDVALQSGHPRSAVAPLEALGSTRFGAESAASASFRLGQLQMDRLANPASAARWFERSLGLGLPGGLVEQAHARLVLAHRAAGQLARARRAARDYLARFPRGHHVEEMRAWLDSPTHDER